MNARVLPPPRVHAQVFEEPGVASSPLALHGAADRCVELFSFAKSYQLGGFRLGFALGNAQAIASLEAVKAPIDFHQYLGIQRAGVACLQLPHTRTRAYAEVWRRRAQALAPLLQQHGFKLPTPAACMYLWCALPAGLGVDDVQFCHQLVAATGIALSPGHGFGPGGHGYVRVALVQPEEQLRQAAEAIGQFVQQLRAQHSSAVNGCAA
jgi:aspartate/methionine/tyrosine aminotransferase